MIALYILYLLYQTIGVQQLVLAGQISEALRLVHSSYPGLLEGHKELLFRLKCRQFVEMLTGNDTKELYENTTSPLQQTSPTLQSPTPPLLHSPRLSGSSHSVASNGTVASNGLVHTNGVQSDDSEDEDNSMEVEQSSPRCENSSSNTGEYPVVVS